MKPRDTYVVAIHVPVHTRGDACFVATDWYRSLCLLRDSFGDTFARFVLVAPRLEMQESDQNLVQISEAADGIRPVPSMDYRCGKRGYWLRERRRWRADVEGALSGAVVAHVGMSDLYRPINYDALAIALRSSAATVFVRDTDEILKFEQLVGAGLARHTLRTHFYYKLYDRAMCHAVSRSDLALLKGRALYARYAAFSRNPHSFEDTSYTTDEIVSDDMRQARLATLTSGRPLRFVYCGRLEPRKGVLDAIRVVAEANRLGVDCRFDIIGDGDQRQAAEVLAAELGVGDRVGFLGKRDYGPSLLCELAGYDAMLFTPLAEDTPRMIFDGYAAGLPILGYDIAYMQERLVGDEAVDLVPLRDVEAGARRVAALDADRSVLARMSDRAHAAAHANAADVWYRRRAEWTLEALDRHRTKVA